ncbi:uncharacterized protein LOC142331692 [Lycorma delicatula]|uniref:uncharacterized protein LOC142331692 n=1 Tax=Lycorma delicatula TaxID=130591 RepID=UPI003F513D9D
MGRLLFFFSGVTDTSESFFERSKRQSHPAATVARFPEVPLGFGPSWDRQRSELSPEPLEYLTPPRPPEPSNEIIEIGLRSAPPSPTIGSVPQLTPDDGSLETKYDLGYDPGDILEPPPSEQFLSTSETSYGTVDRLLGRKQNQESDYPAEPLVNSEGHSSFEDFNPDVSSNINIEPSENKFRPITNPNFHVRPLIPTNFNKRQTFTGTKKENKPKYKRQSVEDEEDNGGEENDEQDSNEDEGHSKKSTGPVYTFVKTDKHGHYKWGVRLDLKGDSSEIEEQPNAAASEPMVASERVRRQGGHGSHGVTGPVHTFQKTDKHAHYKWGVRHHVGHEFAGRR